MNDQERDNTSWIIRNAALAAVSIHGPTPCCGFKSALHFKYFAILRGLPSKGELLAAQPHRMRVGAQHGAQTSLIDGAYAR